MKCPQCSQEMIAGQTHIGGGTASFLFSGSLSLANLTFKAPGWSNHILQETSDVWPAHYCDQCGTLTLETTRVGLSTLEK